MTAIDHWFIQNCISWGGYAEPCLKHAVLESWIIIAPVIALFTIIAACCWSLRYGGKSREPAWYFPFLAISCPIWIILSFVLIGLPVAAVLFRENDKIELPAGYNSGDWV